ncbi:homoserine kinase [Natranaerobius thermophilus]|uniref:Homoserine kinase n=1 Tax=Natranaerobius thermophilus (strain ATCC BAA-1301 / DSM 18059 / JW/NM-WN-LF) TaxID=457570 RepID=KHSE_NATTJ|nr:homoserine kinase [Natranaerobius thermophilus]B2A8C9.1 RecName: Full=Homoserine kinase; Short=HK; Short=HSK [Natranaerobius thermophilus JW/NM-WN-LF]ACB84495.1 homoserine kinase [Natranaerobius thermophilus JW/NM-WN-LF]
MEEKNLVKVQVPGTSANLGAGFDSMGIALNIYNYVSLRQLEPGSGVIIEVKGEGADFISRDKDNLVYQAIAGVYREIYGSDVLIPDLEITLENNIPLARGLGSSAAAIVGGAVAANEMFNGELTRDELLKHVLELEGHLDNIAPAMYGGLTCSLITRENELMFRTVDVVEDWNFIIIVPGQELSTQKAREALPERIAFQDGLFNLSRANMLILAFQQRDYELLWHSMDDELHEPYRAKLIPGLDRLLQEVRGAGIPAAISGAGPSIACVLSEIEEEKIVRELGKEKFSAHGIESNFFKLKPDNSGAKSILH